MLPCECKRGAFAKAWLLLYIEFVRLIAILQ